ncbi:hypothetical protein CMI37_28270 [Candidatus Pacearchaeota archaeon]|nr:hypothetical protein [Candidatus Pacearchaeota archaeon]
MTSLVSYVRGETWEGSSEAQSAWVSVSATTTIPTKFWLRGFHLAVGNVTTTAVSTRFEIWEGSNVTKLFELGVGWYIMPTSAVIPEDSYIDIVDGMYVRSQQLDSAGNPVIRNCSLTVFYTA